MRKFASLILVFLALFFPYMPLLHAVEDTRSIHCGKLHHHEEKNDAHHSMSSCIEIVKKIHRDSSLGTDVLEVTALLLPFQKYFYTPIKLSEAPTQSIYHITDPPEIGTNLTGIIRIIS